MSAEIQTEYITGRIVYAIIRNTIGQVWQTTSSTFVSYVTANLANYNIALTEQGIASGYYCGNFPALISGLYNVIVKERAGSSPAEIDSTIASGEIHWESFTSTVIRRYADTEIASQVREYGLSTATYNDLRAYITGGAYSLSTDSNGRIRIVDGTGVGELNTNAGAIVQVDQLGTQAKVDVNTEVLDVLNVDTYAEPVQGTPGSIISLAAKLNYLYKGWRNKLAQTTTELSVYNAAGSVVDHKATVSDDGTTFNRSALVTGP